MFHLHIHNLEKFLHHYEAEARKIAQKAAHVGEKAGHEAVTFLANEIRKHLGEGTTVNKEPGKE